MPRFVLIPLCIAATAALVVPAFGKQAACEVTIGGQRVDVLCDFTARKGGSFDIAMTDGRALGEAGTLSLDVLRPGIGEIRSGGRSIGAANRSSADPACWKGDGVTLCVRAVGEGRAPAAGSVSAAGEMRGEGFSHPSNRPLVVNGRCHMDGCWWVRVESIEQMSSGSSAIPGTRLRIRMSHMSADLAADGKDYADLATVDSTRWTDTSHLQIFCSMTRPAFLDDDAGWIALSPAKVGGAGEGMTNVYLTLCHSDDYRNGDPYQAGAALGYRGEDYGGEVYRTFGELTAP